MERSLKPQACAAQAPDDLTSRQGLAGSPSSGRNDRILRRDDDLDGLEQPKCPECATVLSDVVAGYECKPRGLRFLRNQV